PRPLLPLFASGELPPVDAVAISYLADGLVPFTGRTRDAIRREWFADGPAVTSVRETHLGRIGTIVIPAFTSELYADSARLTGLVVRAMALAGQIGARTVSLTGLIPSATDYGAEVVRVAAGVSAPLPLVTTGHATTTSAVVAAVAGILDAVGRPLAGERVACIGLGSIGLTALRLLLATQPHPHHLLLCDVGERRAALEALAEDLRRDLGFGGRLDVIESGADVPAQVYEATLIVGATNVPNVVSVDRLRPGTLVVDDSAPHCFDEDAANRRARRQRDILLAEGGLLRSPRRILELVHAPPSRGGNGWTEAVLHGRRDPFEITGCVLSSLLSAAPSGLGRSVGRVGDALAREHFRALGELGFAAARPQCAGRRFGPRAVERFRDATR
ncbi:MAG TPA: hypothetical protein VOB72_11835, partial [Candidatus Dormibacteraeota bacterium]|nr:hypothetical protein [Candidatus Dormibacteraeota bacterium]